MQTVSQNQHARSFPIFGIWQLLLLTTAVAVAGGLFQMLDREGFFGVCCVVHGLTPTFAVILFAKLKHCLLVTRIAVVLALCLGSTLCAVILTTYCFGSDAVVWMLVATLVEWPGQLPLAIALVWIWETRKAPV